jgi:hypothetical protein
MHKASRLLVPIAIAVLLFAGGIAAASVTGTGIYGYTMTQTVLAGDTPYTTTVASAPVNVEAYGAVQIEAVADVSGTTNMTITPQFSLYPGSCSQAPSISWFTASETAIVESDVATNTLVETSLARTFYIAGGDGIAMREISNGGRCARVSVDSNSSVYTATVWIRGVNRQ